jgi:hypothetical protein
LAVYFFCLGFLGLVGDSDIAEPTPTTFDRAIACAIDRAPSRGRVRPITPGVSSFLILLLVLAQCPVVRAMDPNNAVSLGESLVGPATAVIASGLAATVLNRAAPATVLPAWDDDDDDDVILAPTLSYATTAATPLAATSLPQYDEKESELSDRCYADLHTVQEVLKARNTTLSELLASPAGQRFSVVSESQRDYERIALVNTPKLLDGVGKHNKTPVTAKLLDGVSMDTVRRIIPPSMVPSFVQNARAPKMQTAMQTHDLFTTQYAVNTTKVKIDPRETSGLLHWCTTEEFGSRSGDVTETYYRCDPKDECYWQHYRGGGRGMHTVMRHMATPDALEEVSNLTLFHANLTRSSHVCQDTSGAGWCANMLCVCVCIEHRLRVKIYSVCVVHVCL